MCLKTSRTEQWCLSLLAMSVLMRGKQASHSVGMGLQSCFFAEDNWVWPLRKGIPLLWTHCQQPLIEPHPCSIWHELLYATFHLEMAMLHNLGWSQHNASVFLFARHKKMWTQLCYIISLTWLQLNHMGTTMLQPHCHSQNLLGYCQIEESKSTSTMGETTGLV